MLRQVAIFLIVHSYVILISSQVLLECNFDNSSLVANCFTTLMLTVPTLGTIDKDPPISPFSDVTSTTKPTENGELCKLPYRVDSYTWDMYFCNKGFCPTATSPNSKCALGQFAHVRLFETEVYSVPLKAGTGGINGIDDQCIIYYYYIPKGIGIRMSIKLRKVEVDNTTEIIDYVTNSSFNRWTQRKVNYRAKKPGYMIYFDFQRLDPKAPLFGIDEISIQQGFCSDSITTTNAPTITSKEITIMQSETEILTSVSDITVKEISSIATIEQSTVITSIEPIASETTSTIMLATTMMSSTIFPVTASSATSIPNALTMTDADIIITSTSITTKMITDTSEKTTTLKVIPSETSTNIITENIELTSQTSASHLTITVADKQITSNMIQRIIILATVTPIGISGVIIFIVWFKYSVYGYKKKKSNSVEMNQVQPTSL
ncbi:unnamed protein product [Rotaria socialis]|uniref:MAM domain-containing protein n=2 Tax=Rotaria socialis TaxID=392032 RepID=A0A818PI45_9BILA|nr:unnamed protein product [Rotaria socialis]